MLTRPTHSMTLFLFFVSYGTTHRHCLLSLVSVLCATWAFPAVGLHKWGVEALIKTESVPVHPSSLPSPTPLLDLCFIILLWLGHSFFRFVLVLILYSRSNVSQQHFNLHFSSHIATLRVVNSSAIENCCCSWAFPASELSLVTKE